MFLQDDEKSDGNLTIQDSSAIWQPHRKISSVEQSTFTVQRTLNVEINMTGEDNNSDQKQELEFKLQFEKEEDDTEKKDIGTEKI